MKPNAGIIEAMGKVKAEINFVPNEVSSKKYACQLTESFYFFTASPKRWSEQVPGLICVHRAQEQRGKIDKQAKISFGTVS